MSSFRNAIAGFLAELEGLHFSLPVIMHKIEETHKEAVGKLESYLEAHNNSKLEEEVTDKRGTRTVTRYEIDVEHHFALGTLQSGSVRLTAASVIIPRSFVIALVSQFDAFLGRLLRAVYANRPEILNASERNLTFANLIEFNSIDEAREYVLEKEIEAVLRESHTEHFDYLERKLGIELRKGLDIWPTFIEVTERRNLFVHTDGVVSTQYIAVCKKHKVNLILGEKVGQVLEADPGYLNTTYNCLYEIAVKLSQVLWRKLLPGELEEADIYLTMVCYELLKREEYTLTGRLLDFALTLPRHSSQRFKLVSTVNRAIAHKWGGDKSKCNKMLDETDWSASAMDFQLSVAVLKDDFELARDLMRKLGLSELVEKAGYKDWPVFRDFRRTRIFLETYREIFGQSLEIIEVTEDDTITIVEADKSTVEPEN